MLSAALLFGAVFATINIIKSANAVAYYGDTMIDRGEMNYLSSYYKFLFMKELRLTDGISPYDTAEFWERTDKSGVKYGDRLKAGFEEYIRALLSAVAIYDSTLTFSGEEKAAHEKACLEVLEYGANGSVDTFNTEAGLMSFDYNDFKSASILLYKANMAKEALFGKDGANLILQSSLCEEYLATYSRVELIFIRLEDKFVLDENGEFTYNSDGEVITEPLTYSEIAEREEKIATIDTLIAEGRMSPESFAYYREGTDGDASMNSTGYYLNPYAETSAELEAEFPEITSAAFNMQVGEYRKVYCAAIGGVCYVYRTECAAGAYASTTNPFFSDFYSDAADYLFPKTLKDLMLNVVFKDSFDSEFILSQPRNNKYYVKSFK